MEPLDCEENVAQIFNSQISKSETTILEHDVPNIQNSKLAKLDLAHSNSNRSKATQRSDVDWAHETGLVWLLGIVGNRRGQ